jgi:prepilin-type N-terminal cleavage/methylation domain-containing protein
MIHSIHAPRRCKGFTLIEVMLVSGLMSLLVLLLSGAWSGFGRPSADAIARCRVVQEANLAAEALARDLGGSLADQSTGTKEAGRLVGRLAVDGSELWLCFDGEPVDGLPDWAAPDTVIVYDVQADQLVRSDQQAATSYVVAGHVDQMQVTEQVDGVHVELTLTCRDVTKTYTITAKDP